MRLWNLNRLSHFLAVSEAQSLSAAARRIHVSQPALTKSIRKLEEELGFPLFDRDGAMELTPLGKEFLPRARALLADARDAEREMALLRGAESGEVKVACGPLLADILMGQSVARLLESHPKVRTTLEIRRFTELPGRLRDREIDLFAGDVSLLGDDTPDFAIEALPSLEIDFYARTGHPLAGIPRLPAARIRDFPLIGPPLPPWAVTWFSRHTRRSPVDPASPAFAMVSEHYTALKAAVASTDAISAAPRPALRDELAAGRLALLDVDAPPMVSRTGIVHLRQRSLSPAAMALIHAMREVAAEWISPARA